MTLLPGLRPALLLLLIGALLTSAGAHASSAWPPLTGADRAATSEPGMAAILLFEEGGVNDLAGRNRVQTIHRRLKILSEAGAARARVRLTLFEPAQSLLSLEGRTVKEDGSEHSLGEKDISRNPLDGGLTEIQFTLPEAVPGSIVEYRYTIRGGSVPALSGWTFQHEIPCRRSTFTWVPALDRTSHWTLVGTGDLKPDVVPLTSEAAPESLSGVRFEIRGIPAVRPELSGPPDLETRARLVTTYTDFAAASGDYWDAFAAAAQEAQDAFTAGHTRLEEAMRRSGPVPEGFGEKIRHAYDFVQRQVRLAPEGSVVSGSTADSVFLAGSADADDMNLLFIAALQVLDVRATRGFVVDRDRAFFHRDIQSPAQFSRSLVVVTPGNGEVFFFSPGTPAAPPGIIPWYVQGVTAVLAGAGGALFVTTPVDAATVNQTTRTVDLAVDDKGHLKAGITLDYSGQAEIEARSLNDSDAAAYRTALVADWNRRLPRATVDSVVVKNAGNSDRNLGVRAVLSAREFATFLDGRLIVNPAVLGRESGAAFPPGERRHPVLFPYARVTTDNVRITIPRGWKLATLPEPVTFENEIGSYRTLWSWDGERVNYQRVYALLDPRVQAAEYPALLALQNEAAEGDRSLLAFERFVLPPSRR